MKIPYWQILILPPILYVIGNLLNALVMTANLSRMPVLYPGGVCPPPDHDILHTCMTAQTHLKFLADWIVQGHAAISLGDLFLDAYEYIATPAIYVWAALMIRDRNLTD